MLRTAAELGVEFFDTSEIQGPYTGEELLGDAFARAQSQSASQTGPAGVSSAAQGNSPGNSPGRAPTIATKFGWNIDNGQPTGELNSRPENIRRVAQESARRLGVERLDLFMQHRVDPEVPIEEVAGTVGELVDEGLVAHFGLCEVSATTIARAQCGPGRGDRAALRRHRRPDCFGVVAGSRCAAPGRHAGVAGQYQPGAH